MPARDALGVFMKIVLLYIWNGWVHSCQIWQLDEFCLDATDALLGYGLLSANSEEARFPQTHARGLCLNLLKTVHA